MEVKCKISEEENINISVTATGKYTTKLAEDSFSLTARI